MGNRTPGLTPYALEFNHQALPGLLGTQPGYFTYILQYIHCSPSWCRCFSYTSEPPNWCSFNTPQTSAPEGYLALGPLAPQAHTVLPLRLILSCHSGSYCPVMKIVHTHPNSRSGVETRITQMVETTRLLI